MTITYRPPWFARLGNAVTVTLVRAGLPVGLIYLLTVRGRKSGQPRTTPVAVVQENGKRYLVAVYGLVNWVYNLRAAGEATLTRARRDEPVQVRELPAQEAAPILQRTVGKGPSFLRHYFDITPTATLADYEREAARHPVFEILGA